MTNQFPAPGEPNPASPLSAPGETATSATSPESPPLPNQQPHSNQVTQNYGYLAPINKPGVIPLRPLSVGDLYNGAFATIRTNPKATIGMAALVTLAVMLIPLLVTIAAFMFSDFGSAKFSDAAGVAQVFNLFSTSIIGALTSFFIAGVLVPLANRATVGEKLTASAAWKQLKPKMWRLIGLILTQGLSLFLVVAVAALIIWGLASTNNTLLGLVGFGVGLAAAIFAMWISIKFFSLAPAALVTEDLSILASLKRSGVLTHGRFWQVLGITILTSLVVSFAGSIVSIPAYALMFSAGIVGGSGGSNGLAMALLLSGTNLQVLLTGALITPFQSIVSILLYLDQRIRKEGFDMTLLQYVQRRNQNVDH